MSANWYDPNCRRARAWDQLHSHRPFSRQAHRDWGAWLPMALKSARIIACVMTDSLSSRPIKTVSASFQSEADRRLRDAQIGGSGGD